MSFRCPHCRGRHEAAAEGRACAGEEADARAQMRAESEAERRNERYFEERGAWEPEDPREVEAQMRDDALRAAARANSRAVNHDLGYGDNLLGLSGDCEGGVCKSLLEQCSKHSRDYQARWGSAANAGEPPF